MFIDKSVEFLNGKTLLSKPHYTYKHKRTKVYPSFESQWRFDLSDNPDDWVVGPAELDFPYWVMDADMCVVEIAQSKEPLFSLEYDNYFGRIKVKRTKLGNRLLNCMRRDFLSVKRKYPHHTLSPYSELLLQTVLNSRLTPDDIANFDADADSTVIKFNQLVNDLRAAAKAAGFKAMIAEQLRAVRDNEESLQEYIDGLFDRHSKLLVVRVDLKFPSTFRPSHFGRAPSPEYVRRCMAKFLKNWKRQFPTIVGFAKKFECGAKIGYHYHLLVFLNGHKSREDITIGDHLCQRWLDVTEGNGKPWNCNRDKPKYQARGMLGIGMIKRTDKELRTNLVKAALYLIKLDYYVRLDIPAKWKTFTHGELPSSDRGGKGRHLKDDMDLRVQRARKPIMRGRLT